jgi:hypothetical protein
MKKSLSAYVKIFMLYVAVAFAFGFIYFLLYIKDKDRFVFSHEKIVQYQQKIWESEKEKWDKDISRHASLTKSATEYIEIRIIPLTKFYEELESANQIIGVKAYDGSSPSLSKDERYRLLDEMINGFKSNDENEEHIKSYLEHEKGLLSEYEWAVVLNESENERSKILNLLTIFIEGTNRGKIQEAEIETQNYRARFELEHITDGIQVNLELSDKNGNDPLHYILQEKDFLRMKYPLGIFLL